MARRNRRSVVKSAPDADLLTVDEAVRLAAEEAARLASEQTALSLSRGVGEPYSAAGLRSALKQRAARQVYGFNDPEKFTTAQDPRLRPFSRVSVETLRTLARNYDILAACITHLKSEVVKVPLKVVAKCAHGDSGGTKKQIQQAKAFLSVTGGLGGYGCHREEYEALLLDDLLVIGAGCSFLEYATLGARRDGSPDSVTAIDAATIRPLVTAYGFAPGPQEYSYEQWIQGIRVAGFKRDELIYRGLPIFARTDSPYWLSPVELLVSVVYTALKADEWNRTWLTDGNTPDWWMKMPDTMSPDQIIEWLDLFETMLAGNAAQRHKVKVTPGEPRTGNARKEADFAQFETWLMQRTCSVMGVNPASIGHHSDTYKDSQEIAFKSTKDGRIAQLLAFRRSHYNELLERKGLLDVEVQDEVFDAEDAKARAERHQIELSSGQRTLNETRKEDGLEPYGHPLADVPLVGSSLVVLDSLQGAAARPHDSVGRALRRFEKKALNRLRENGRAVCGFEDEALPAELVEEICGELARCGSREEVRGVFEVHRRGYDPNQPRDDHGRWSSGGGDEVFQVPLHLHSRPMQESKKNTSGETRSRQGEAASGASNTSPASALAIPLATPNPFTPHSKVQDAGLRQIHEDAARAREQILAIHEDHQKEKAKRTKALMDVDALQRRDSRRLRLAVIELGRVRNPNQRAALERRRQQLEESLEHAQSERRRLSDELRLLHREAGLKYLTALQQPEGVTLDSQGNPKWTPNYVYPFREEDRKRYEKGVNRFGRLAGAAMCGGFDFKVDRESSGRSGWDSLTATAAMEDHASVHIVVHELGHGLEDNNSLVLRAAVAYWERKTMGETERKLNDIENCTAYRDDEVSKPDDFASTYMGKVYRDGAGDIEGTEIISSSLEFMDKKPAWFAKTDPESFEFIFALMRDPAATCAHQEALLAQARSGGTA